MKYLLLMSYLITQALADIILDMSHNVGEDSRTWVTNPTVNLTEMYKGYAANNSYW